MPLKFGKGRTSALPGKFATAAVLLFGAWLVSGQLWRFVLPLPAPLVKAATDPVQVAGTVAAGHLFGIASQPTVPAGPATPYRLLGVIAGAGRQPGVALLQTDGQPPLAVPAGGEVEPGLVLRAVEPRRVRLDQSGREIELNLPEGR